jgi:hypothetical protein
MPPHERQPRRGRAPLDNTGLARRVQGILATKGLTLYKVAALTRARYPSNPSYRIPGNLYFQLRSAALSPNLHQLAALSEFSGYRFADWLAVFGFYLEDISFLQAALHYPRTTLLDSHIYDPDARISWFRDHPSGGVLPPVAPLSQLLEVSGSPLLSSLLPVNGRDVLYAKVGRQDALAFPDLIPGSIVRANPRWLPQLLPKAGGEFSKAIFLVEHSRGFSCSRLHFTAKNRVTLTATQLSFANVELLLGSEARILGVLDLEFRPLTVHRRTGNPCALPEVAPGLARLWRPAPLNQGTGTERPTVLLRNARLRAGLSFRHASEMSRAVATALRDTRYFASPGALSDYEAKDTPPRHIHKLFTLSILYSVRFAELLNSFGVRLNGRATAPIPEEWMARTDSASPVPEHALTPQKMPASGFLNTILGRLGPVPFFLRGALASLSGLPSVSLRDVFWAGGLEKAMHPSLAGALFVIVNRRNRKPPTFRHKSAWEQPLYLLMRRNGSYLLASCGMENGTIVVHPFTERFVPSERLRNRVDAEVVGQIVAIVRSLPPP